MHFGCCNAIAASVLAGFVGSHPLVMYDSRADAVDRSSTIAAPECADAVEAQAGGRNHRILVIVRRDASGHF